MLILLDIFFFTESFGCQEINIGRIIFRYLFTTYRWKLEWCKDLLEIKIDADWSVDWVMWTVQSCVLISFSIKCNILSADVNYHRSLFISMQMSCQELRPYLYHFLLQSTKCLPLYGSKGSKHAFKMLCNLGNVSVTGKPSVDLMCDTYQICAQRNVCPHALSHSLQESFYI